MVEWETLEAKEIKFGNNKFLEVARKKVRSEEGENEIISLSKGFFAPDGQKRFKQAFGFPADTVTVDGLVEALQAIRQGIGSAEETAEETEEATQETTEETSAE